MSYKALLNSTITNGSFSIVPIRYEDRLDIMKWRNDQIYHLRQNSILTKEDQELYFKNVINPLKDELQPSQILFSFLKNNICIGYGGLVHINWVDKNAEISFIMDTQEEKNNFELNWTNFLSLLEIITFSDLKFHKFYTYAFDLRPYLYKVLENCDFTKEATLTKHHLHEGKFIDVIIHSKINF
jgi:RimJ/RimL family protein N-acetyltransferase